MVENAFYDETYAFSLDVILEQALQFSSMHNMQLHNHLVLLHMRPYRPKIQYQFLPMPLYKEETQSSTLSNNFCIAVRIEQLYIEARRGQYNM